MIRVNSHYVFSGSKSHLILTLLATQIQTGNGCIIASKYIKESEKHIYREKLLWFVCFFYSMGLKKTLLETCNSRDKTGVHGPAFLLGQKLIATHCYFWY
jgi:hypothetical protein